MTDKQLSEIYKSIDDFNAFLIEVNSSREYLTEKLEIRFTNAGAVEIRHKQFIENLSVEDFKIIKTELVQQWRSDKEFNKIKANKTYEREINIRDDKTFVITDAFVEMLSHGREISSGRGWYINQIRHILKLFADGYTLIHNDSKIRSKHEFTDHYLRGLSGFKSLEDELALSESTNS